MPVTIDVTTRRRIEVPDELIVLNDLLLQKGIERVNPVDSVKGLLNNDETMAEAYVIGTVVIAPDPDQLKDYEGSLAEFERQRTLCAAKRIVGATDVPTDDELREQILEDPPSMVPLCSICGSTEFRYDEGRYESSSASDFKSDDDGVVIVFSSSRTYDGDSWPGVMCDSCDAALDLPADIEIEWSY